MRCATWVMMTIMGAVVAVSCNPREAGCLDVEAVDFDFAADRNDPAMCTYPTFFIDVLYRWGDDPFSPDTFYTNDFEQLLAIESFFVVLSDFVIRDQMQNPLQVIDSISWCTQGSPDRFEVRDDFVIVDRSRFSFPVGSINWSGQQSEWSFTLGVNDALVPVCADSLPDNHPLVSKQGLLDREEGRFLSARFVVSMDTVSTGTDTFQIMTAPSSFVAPINKAFVRGRNDTLGLIIDLKEIFSDTDLSLSKTVVETQLGNQLGELIRDNN